MSSLYLPKTVADSSATASNFQNPLSFDQLFFLNEQGKQEGILFYINPRNLMMQFSDQEQKNIHKTITD